MSETPTWLERGHDVNGLLLWEEPVPESLAERRLFNWIIMASYVILRTNRNLVELMRVDPTAKCQHLTWERIAPILVDPDVTDRSWWG